MYLLRGPIVALRPRLLLAYQADMPRRFAPGCLVPELLAMTFRDIQKAVLSD